MFNYVDEDEWSIGRAEKIPGLHLNNTTTHLEE
jgi:hypothetical protein